MVAPLGTHSPVSCDSAQLCELKSPMRPGVHHQLSTRRQATAEHPRGDVNDVLKSVLKLDCPSLARPRSPSPSLSFLIWKCYSTLPCKVRALESLRSEPRVHTTFSQHSRNLTPAGIDQDSGANIFTSRSCLPDTQDSEAPFLTGPRHPSQAKQGRNNKFFLSALLFTAPSRSALSGSALSSDKTGTMVQMSVFLFTISLQPCLEITAKSPGSIGHLQTSPVLPL